MPMLFLISPAKALDYESPAHVTTHTQPLFVPQASELIEVLRDKSPQEIAELMDLSDQLSGLNVARYQAWQPTFTARNSKQGCWRLMAMCTVVWTPGAWGLTTSIGCNSTCAS